MSFIQYKSQMLKKYVYYIKENSYLKGAKITTADIQADVMLPSEHRTLAWAFSAYKEQNRRCKDKLVIKNIVRFSTSHLLRWWPE